MYLGFLDGQAGPLVPSSHPAVVLELKKFVVMVTCHTNRGLLWGHESKFGLEGVCSTTSGALTGIPSL